MARSICGKAGGVLQEDPLGESVTCITWMARFVQALMPLQGISHTSRSLLPQCHLREVEHHKVHLGIG